MRERHYRELAQRHSCGHRVDGRAIKVMRLFRLLLAKPRTSSLPSIRLVDIGCGTGELTSFLKEELNAREAYGVEIEETFATRAVGRGIDVSIVDLDTEDIPLGSGSFDAIFCGEHIEHLTDPDHLLDEIHRLLAPQGVCVITTPNLGARFNRIALASGYQPFHTSVSFRYDVGHLRAFKVGAEPGHLGHLRLFTYRALIELVELHGFEIVGVEAIRIPDMTDTSVASPLTKVLIRLVSPIDGVLSFFPGLACGIAIAIRKERSN